MIHKRRGYLQGHYIASRHCFLHQTEPGDKNKDGNELHR